MQRAIELARLAALAGIATEDPILTCGCACQHFMVHRSGKLVCVGCRKVNHQNEVHAKVLPVIQLTGDPDADAS